MNTVQIWKILENDSRVNNHNFLGVFPIDKIPVEAEKYPCCCVVNTKPHTDPGEHWICFLKTEDNRGIYFDSFGFPPYNLPQIGQVMESCDQFTFNNTQLQSLYSTVCGQYTIFVLCHLSRGYTMEHIVELLNDGGDVLANDAVIYNYIKNMYGHYINMDKLSAVANPMAMYQSVTQSANSPAETYF